MFRNKRDNKNRFFVASTDSMINEEIVIILEIMLHACLFSFFFYISWLDRILTLIFFF